MAEKIVADVPVPAVSYHGVHRLVRSILMGGDCLCEQLSLICRAGGYASGSDHLTAGIYRPMGLVAEL